MTSKITIYSKPGCNQCYAAAKLIQRSGSSYELIDITQDEAAYDLVKNKYGAQSLPVIVKNDEVVIGFFYDKIKKMAA